MRLKFFGYFPTSRYGYLHGKISYITDRSLQDPVILSSDFLSSFALDYNRTKIYFGFLLVKFVKQLGIEERGEVAFNLNLPWNSLQLFHTLSPPPLALPRYYRKLLLRRDLSITSNHFLTHRNGTKKSVLFGW